MVGDIINALNGYLPSKKTLETPATSFTILLLTFSTKSHSKRKALAVMKSFVETARRHTQFSQARESPFTPTAFMPPSTDLYDFRVSITHLRGKSCESCLWGKVLLQHVSRL